MSQVQLEFFLLICTCCYYIPYRFVCLYLVPMVNLLIWSLPHAIAMPFDATIDNVTEFNRGGDWNTGGTCHLETMPDLASLPVSSQMSVHLNIVLEVLSERLNMSEAKKLDLLNVTYLTSLRKDGHSSLYYLGPGIGPPPLHRQDCSHWCLPGVPDSWNELLYALFLKWEYSRIRKSMNASQAPVWLIRKFTDLTAMLSQMLCIAVKLTPPVILAWDMELPLCYRRHDYQMWSEIWLWLFSGQCISSSSEDLLTSTYLWNDGFVPLKKGNAACSVAIQLGVVEKFAACHIHDWYQMLAIDSAFELAWSDVNLIVHRRYRKCICHSYREYSQICSSSWHFLLYLCIYELGWNVIALCFVLFITASMGKQNKKYQRLPCKNTSLLDVLPWVWNLYGHA